MSITLRQPIIFLDVETGGRDSARHPLLTIGAVTLGEDGLISRPIHLRVKHTDYCVEPGALAVTGINIVEHDRAAQRPEEIADALREYAAGVGRVMLGGHNFGFDLRFLRPLLPDIRKVFRSGHVDTKLTAQFLIHAGLLPHGVGTPLAQLTEHFGIEYTAHDALEDATATARVYVELLRLARAGIQATGD
ncbi:3'-5' exonuclease [Deinococcus arenicola]|uniref:3'-5' exonuclease n=1 Tax=Deinococcus arenicola TaxID=2994950 RepID=A0ABU4DVJ5_9DEIO|nr:3'-5' exonuclease [Deinococcus sp. ZS9-10]MDV6376471.1 3'-5' exonuclease [Deinococcus sp. ZS9-10]